MNARVWVQIIVIVAALAAGQNRRARADEPIRVHDVIDADQTWSGHVMITGETMIDGATVSVAAGTTIEFAVAEPNVNPTLTVGSPVHRGGRLDLLATSNEPITIRTRPGTNAGRIIVYLRGRRPTTTAPAVPGDTPPPIADAQTWRFIHFQDLGFPAPTSGSAMMSQVTRLEPALLFHVLDAGSTLTVSECAFEKTTSLTIEARANTKITVSSNQFAAPRGRTSIDIAAELEARRAEAYLVVFNRAAGAIRVRAGSGQIGGNTLVGPDASIVVEDSPAPHVSIAANYVHNTTKQDDGHYCLSCDNPDAVIEGNIFRGGTTCVVAGSRNFKGNILIAEPELVSRAVRRAHTHQLVAALPAGAVFERNLLIGPAYSLLIPQAMPSSKGESSTAPTLVRNNTFDGLVGTTRAIHVNPAGFALTTLRIENNLFLRASSMVYDESRKGPSLAYADFNAAAPTPRRPFDQALVANRKEGQEGWAANDLRRESIADLRLGEMPDGISDFDEDIQSGKLTVAALRDELFDAYRPQSDSPLVGAGRPDSDNPSGPRPAIGCCEPSKR